MCPWCYLGDARLKKALTQTKPNARIRWQPFQLQPDLPPEGVLWKPFAERKFGSWARALAVLEQVGAVGRAEGLDFHFADIAKANQTADAHRLILYAETYNKGERAARALYWAYFEAEEDLNDRAVLVRLIGRNWVRPESGQPFSRKWRRIARSCGESETCRRARRRWRAVLPFERLTWFVGGATGRNIGCRADLRF